MMPTGPGYRLIFAPAPRAVTDWGSARVPLWRVGFAVGLVPALQIAAQVTQTAIHQPMTLLMLLRLAPNLRQSTHQTERIFQRRWLCCPSFSMSVVLLTMLCGTAAGGICARSTRSRHFRLGCVATIRRRPHHSVLVERAPTFFNPGFIVVLPLAALHWR